MTYTLAYFSIGLAVTAILYIKATKIEKYTNPQD